MPKALAVVVLILALIGAALWHAPSWVAKFGHAHQVAMARAS